MSEVETNEVPEEKEELEMPTALDLSDILSKLVPPDSVTITDIHGNKIKVPGSISARRQIKVFRIIKSIFDGDKMETILGSAYAEGLSFGSLADSVMGVATDEEVINMVGDIFSNAFPDLLDGKDPLDELPLEEVIIAIIPLLERFIKKAGMGVVGVVKALA